MEGVKILCRCLCGTVSCTLHLESQLPVRSSICHHDQCRRNLGALCHSTFRVKEPPEDMASLIEYRISASLTRYFCGQCGSHMFEKSDEWRIQSGVVDGIHSVQVLDALEEITDHSYVHDTLDGGLYLSLEGSGHLPETNDMQQTELKHSLGAHHQLNFTESSRINETNTDDLARLWASCACGGVRFYLTRPNVDSKLCSSPWPDLIVPYQSGSPENFEDAKWWVREGGKWLAGTCACRSCRLGLGSPIQAWTFVCKKNIFQPDGSALSYDRGTLKSFSSSPGIAREFCRVCGSTVFWHSLERDDVVDVSVGNLRSDDGALARSWLEWWTDRVSFAEEALDKQLIDRLEKGLHLLNTAKAT